MKFWSSVSTGLDLISAACMFMFNVVFLQTKNNRAMKTQQLYIQDNNRALMTYFNVHFDSVRCLAGKRTTTARSTLVSPLAKSTKHAMLMSEYGIQYDQPLSPVNIATLRADRIAKDNRDKKLNEGKLQNSVGVPLWGFCFCGIKIRAELSK